MAKRPCSSCDRGSHHLHRSKTRQPGIRLFPDLLCGLICGLGTHSQLSKTDFPICTVNWKQCLPPGEEVHEVATEWTLGLTQAQYPSTGTEKELMCSGSHSKEEQH